MKRLTLVFCLLIGLAPVIEAQPKTANTPKKLISSKNHIFMRPNWSPNGKHIAFTIEKNEGIWLSNAKGKDINQLTSDKNAGFGFSWSDDSKTILARPTLEEGNLRYHQVKTYEISTKKEKIILSKTKALQSLPTWSNSNAQIAFLMNGSLEKRSSGKLGLKVAKKQNATPLVLGNRLISTSEQNNSIKLKQFKGRYIFNAKLSPNGEKLVFQVNGLGMFVANANGSNTKHLGFVEQASWMPDNRYIIVSKTKDNGTTVTSGELMSINTETGESFNLFSDPAYIILNPSVSSDGGKVLFENVNDGAIYLLGIK